MSKVVQKKTDLVDEIVDWEENQAVGYFVSNERGNDTTGDGSQFKPFKTIDTAIAKGMAYGDECIIIILDTRGAHGYDCEIPAGEYVSIVGYEPLASVSGYVDFIELGDGCILNLDNLYVNQIWEASGISSATIFIEECVVLEIKDSAGTGFATNTSGIFSNTIIQSTTPYNDIKGMASAFGTLILTKFGAEAFICLNGADMDSGRIRNVADPTAVQDVATKNYVDTQNSNQIVFQSDVTLAGVTPVNSDISAWANGDRGHGIGTGGREFYMVKRAGAVKYVEMS